VANLLDNPQPCKDLALPGNMAAHLLVLPFDLA